VNSSNLNVVKRARSQINRSCMRRVRKTPIGDVESDYHSWLGVACLLLQDHHPIASPPARSGVNERFD
jgi:hypothetical protein